MSEDTKQKRVSDSFKNSGSGSVRGLIKWVSSQFPGKEAPEDDEELDEEGRPRKKQYNSTFTSKLQKIKPFTEE